MSDRAAAEVKFNTLLKGYRDALMPTVIANYRKWCTPWNIGGPNDIAPDTGDASDTGDAHDTDAHGTKIHQKYTDNTKCMEV